LAAEKAAERPMLAAKAEREKSETGLDVLREIRENGEKA